ncbi:MAG: hypothetical protein ACK5KN_04300 [Dysgonomonas sp.]|uniref:hypothetical protein n=1 Tax=Dysgonomonas sp. TaxID=1891233 RepID=UPI003A864784
MAKTFVLHDESVNSHGFWMMTSGCDISQFEKNPIMLWDHNMRWSETRESKLPIGHWENVHKKGSQILGDAVFDSDDFSQTIAKKVESGTLRMASVGAISIETSEDPKYIKPGQRYATILKWKLKEASIVNIGANDNALVALYDDNTGAMLNLSADGDCPLKLLNTPNNMDKEFILVKQLLKLSDQASEQDVVAAVNKLIALRDELDSVKADNKTLKEKVDAIRLAEEQANAAESKELLDEAFKDGRLNDDEKHTVRQSWEDMFKASHDKAKVMLSSLPKRQNASRHLSGGDNGQPNAWAKRQKEIEDANRGK